MTQPSPVNWTTGPIAVPLAKLARGWGAAVVQGVAVASLVAVALVRWLPRMGEWIGPLWVAAIVLNIVAAWVSAVRYGRALPPLLIVGSAAGVALSFYLLTVHAPHRSRSCFTEAPAPVWSAFCVQPDSSSYYFPYAVGSTRQPLYPWFIELATARAGFNPPEYLKTTAPGQVRTDPADPLFRVVRIQIVLLMAAAVIACVAMMRWLGSTLPALAFVALNDQQFLSAVELNTVLTEPLVQTFLMLLVAAYATFFLRMRWLPLMLGAGAAGLAYLTRQAALYQVVLVGVMMLSALFVDWRRWWRPCAAALALFVAIAAVPDIYALAKTGDLGRQQESLQYQYRIAHALQYARPDDLALMPDDESRAWLGDAIRRRDIAHRTIAEQYRDDEFGRMIYDIAANLYEVATPVGDRAPAKSPQFFMKVATPILQRHWLEYTRFSFRFWQFGLTHPGLVKLDPFRFSVWYIYAALWGLVALLRTPNALAAGGLILAHWAAVALISLAAVPIPRMINASECLVIMAAVVLGWEMLLALGPRGVVVLEHRKEIV